MAIKLHRCSNVWVKMGAHPCWRVQSALDEQGIEYELVRMPVMRWNREETEKATGQKQYPWIEFEDGSIYREESKTWPSGSRPAS
jgi:glutaredoxin